MSLDALATQIQIATLVLAAAYNGILAYDVRISLWRTIGSGVTAILLALIAYQHYAS